MRKPKKQRLTAMEGKHHDAKPRYTRKGRYPLVHGGTGCVWCDLGLRRDLAEGYHRTRLGIFPCTRKS
jgi:hypothetical protein